MREPVSGHMDGELGPFGRAFVGKSPSKGAIIMMFPFWIFFLIGLVRLFDPEYSFFLICGLEVFLLIIISSIFAFTTRVIEPHFNKGDGKEVVLSSSIEKDGDPSDSDLVMSGRDLFRKSRERVAEIWDFTGDGLVTSFEIQEGGTTGFYSSESGLGVWSKSLLMWFSVYAWFHLAAFGTLGMMLVSGVGGRTLDILFEISTIITYLGTGLIFLVPIVIGDKMDYVRSLFRNPGIISIFLLVVVITIVDLIVSGIVGTAWDIVIGIPDQELVYFADPSSANDPLIMLLLFVGIAICPAIFEELVFRGYILDTFRSWYSDTYSIIASGILFGLIHYSIFTPFDFYPVVATSIGGFLYAWARIRTGSLWVPILCHALWNGSIVVFEYM